MNDSSELRIAEAAELVRGGKLSPLTLTAALLERIDRLDKRFHAFIRVTPEPALAAAREAERDIGAGNWRGPLHGIPFALKDIIDWAGFPTTAPSKLLIGNIASSHGHVRAPPQAPSGIMPGKLATHEVAL